MKLGFGTPVLSSFDVRNAGGRTVLSWSWAGPRRPQVVVLRSTEWYCDHPSAAIGGAWGQSTIYAGTSADSLTCVLDDGSDAFYTLFARFGQAAWRRPVKVRVFAAGHEPKALGLPPAGAAATARDELIAERLVDGRYVDVSGADEPAPAFAGPRDWLGIVGVAGCLSLVVGLVAGGPPRALACAGVLLAAVVRAVEGPNAEFGRFRSAMGLGAVLSLLPLIAGGLFWWFAKMIGREAVLERIHFGQLVTAALLVAAMSAVWFFGEQLFDDSGLPRRPKPILVVLGIAVAVVAYPLAGLPLAIVAGVPAYRRAVIDSRSHRQQMLAEVRRAERAQPGFSRPPSG